ncbi:type II toxin-antitoxin system VapC family toxin [Oryzibacter oryziterrae]|uniref:type II toxin-antitoxin system VapC family toxin n=1 Tax=Oryzibacter oryziterrae TaxID=2766474 RepID=UPI001F271104|nr:type II toxin-antitoxin system VapC family toxin [Oryzibacter oryziterrae]
MYLVDTNVLSDLVAPKPRPDLSDWLDQHSEVLFLSSVTAAEVVAGIAKARRDGATTKARRLDDWWRTVEHLYGDRILAFGLREARHAGEFHDLARAAGRSPGFADTAIAATASVHGLTLLTRNVRHFEVFGLKVVDPFEGME